MTIPTVDYTGRFADFMSKSFPNLSCPPLPKKVDDLPATIEMALQNEALAGRKAYLAQQKAQKEFADLPLGHPLKAPSPESVQRFKEQHGITGRASWELDG